MSRDSYQLTGLRGGLPINRLQTYGDANPISETTKPMIQSWIAKPVFITTLHPALNPTVCLRPVVRPTG